MAELEGILPVARSQNEHPEYPADRLCNPPDHRDGALRRRPLMTPNVRP
jgi:hypothetical protein